MEAERHTEGAAIVVVGASAGGIETVRSMLDHFPADFSAPIVIVIHRAPIEEDDRLARVIARGSPLPVKRAAHGDRALAGHVYIAPAGSHLKLRGHTFALSMGPKENSVRPSIDVLFRSAAEGGGNTVGVILSGVLDDGTAGLAAIKAAGGYAIVQDPDEAPFGDMPRNAIAHVNVDAIVPAEAIGATAKGAVNAMTTRLGLEAAPMNGAGHATRFSCPDCGGVLSEFVNDGITRYICRTGHAYSPAVLFNRQDDDVEWALWAAVRALEERAEMSSILAARLSERDRAGSVRLAQQSSELLERAGRIRSIMATPTERFAEVVANDRAVDA